VVRSLLHLWPEADYFTGVDESAVTDPESGDLERLAALYADLATNFDGKRSHYIDFLVSSFWLRQKKVAEVSRIDELVVMAHQLRGTLDYADLGESAVGVGGEALFVHDRAASLR